jgi:hypothetical protein
MFESWFRMVAAGAGMARAAIHTGEAVVAADRVIRSRSTTIADAFDNPFGADYAELARLVPEKILASTRAAGDVAVETLAIWSAAGRAWQSPAFSRTTELMTRTMGLYAIGLRPFHTAVTGNDRRLHRKARKGA